MRPRCPTCEHRAVQVDVDELPPLLDGLVGPGSEVGAAGVRDDHVKPPIAVHCRIDDAGYRRLVGDIRGNERRSVGQCGLRRMTCTGDDRSPFADKAFDDAAPDSGGPSGHDRNPAAVTLSHWRSPESCARSLTSHVPYPEHRHNGDIASRSVIAVDDRSAMTVNIWSPRA